MQCLQYELLFSTLTTKEKGMCKGASKQSPDLKNYTAPGQRPPVFEFLDPPLITMSAKQMYKFIGNWNVVDQLESYIKIIYSSHKCTASFCFPV